MEDAGALPIELDVGQMGMGDEIVLNIDHDTAECDRTKNGAEIAKAPLKTPVLLDEVRAGGRINLIIGRGLTTKAREALGLPASTELFRLPQQPADTGKGYTQAQKMVGRACGLPEGTGIRPGTYCEPKMTTVGSQDTTGPMTRDELKDLACLGFLRRPGHAVLLPHCRLPQASGREHAPHPAGLHHEPWRRIAASG
jgi:aconitate hydratase 2/2-methylisocitrate dehydratase